MKYLRGKIRFCKKLFSGIMLFTAICLNAAEEFRGEVMPPTFQIGRQSSFTFDGKFLPGKYSIAANMVYPASELLRISQVDSRWGFAADSQYFYAAIISPTGGSLTTAHNERDGNLWEDDSYELFLLDLEGKNGFHIIFNSATGIYDAQIINGLEQRGSEWNARDIRIQSHVANGNWSAELRIALSDISNIVSGKFKVAMFRSSCGKRALEGIVQFQSVFFAPTSFAVAEIADNATKVSWQIDEKALSSGLLHTILSGNIPVTPGSKTTWHIGVTPLVYGVYDAFNQSKEQTLQSGEITDAAFELPIRDLRLPQMGTLHFTVKQGDSVLFERRIPYDLQDFSKLEITTLYADKDRKNLCAAIVTPPGDKREYTCGLRRSDNQVVVSKKYTISGNHLFTLPLDGVAPGEYTFFVSAPGGKEVCGRFAVLPPQPEWLGNTLGFTNGKAPAPWSDITISGNRAFVWNREIIFNGIPVKILCNGHSVAENMRFEANGEAMTCTRFNWVKQAGDVSEFESEFSNAQGRLIVKGSLEFDGLIWLNCRFIPLPGKKLPDIRFAMDIPAYNGRFVYTSEHNANNSRQLGAADTWTKNMLTNKPTFWVGTPARGIYFLADDLRGWNLDDYTRSVSISAERNGRREVSIPILDAKLNELGKEYQIEFALQGTPTRPMPRNWRNFRVNGSPPVQNIRLYQDEITQLFSVPMPVRPYAQNVLRQWKNRGVNALPYLAFLAVSPFTNEFKYFSEEWRMTPHRRPPIGPEKYTTYTMVCPRGAGYADYFVWNIARMIDAIDCNGLYFDYAQPGVYLCNNVQHGCGWYDNKGVLRPSIRIKAARAMLMRIYVLLKEKRPDGLLCLHDSGGIIPAFDCLADLTYNGEQLAQAMFNNNLSYSGLYEPDKMMLEQNGEIWGVPTFYIPQFLRALQIWDVNRYGDYSKIGWRGLSEGFLNDPASSKKLWQLAGLLLVNGGDFSGEWGMGQLMMQLHGIKTKIGWDESARFIGWFDRSNPFRLEAPRNRKMLSSTYSAKNGFMIVAMNDTKGNARFRISVPAGMQNWKFHEEITNTDIRVNNGCIELNVPAETPRFIIVTQN